MLKIGTGFVLFFEDQKRTIKQLKFSLRLVLCHCNNFPKGILIMLINTDFNRHY